MRNCIKLLPFFVVFGLASAFGVMIGDSFTAVAGGVAAIAVLVGMTIFLVVELKSSDG